MDFVIAPSCVGVLRKIGLASRANEGDDLSSSQQMFVIDHLSPVPNLSKKWLLLIQTHFPLPLHHAFPHTHPLSSRRLSKPRLQLGIDSKSNETVHKKLGFLCITDVQSAFLIFHPVDNSCLLTLLLSNHT